mmetsp:Transcript_126476/g.369531  ORF Transcript_126476/g.369531 Transcript_126476/m.369531 type:complete len:244 (+) Transcript_126476:332-1063(+)
MSPICVPLETARPPRHRLSISGRTPGSRREALQFPACSATAAQPSGGSPSGPPAAARSPGRGVALSECASSTVSCSSWSVPGVEVCLSDSGPALLVEGLTAAMDMSRAVVVGVDGVRSSHAPGGAERLPSHLMVVLSASQSSWGPPSAPVLSSSSSSFASPCTLGIWQDCQRRQTCGGSGWPASGPALAPRSQGSAASPAAEGRRAGSFCSRSLRKPEVQGERPLGRSPSAKTSRCRVCCSSK